jgi:hypothetical protein
MLFLCEKAVQSRRIRLSSGLGIEEGRVSTYRRVDSSAAWRARAPCRTAVPVVFGSFLGRSSPYIFIPIHFQPLLLHCCSVDQTHIPHTHTQHTSKDRKDVRAREIEVEDINASDSKGRSSTHKPKYPRLTPAHVGP